MGGIDMSTPEGKVKDFIDKRMKSWYPDAFKYAPPGVGRFGKNGMPDRIWWIKATSEICISAVIEAKAEGNEATSLQIKTLKELQSQGVIAAIVTGKNEELMFRIKKEIDRRIGMVRDVLR